jgi:hypothetical protein
MSTLQHTPFLPVDSYSQIEYLLTGTRLQGKALLVSQQWALPIPPRAAALATVKQFERRWCRYLSTAGSW